MFFAPLTPPSDDLCSLPVDVNDDEDRYEQSIFGECQVEFHAQFGCLGGQQVAILLSDGPILHSTQSIRIKLHLRRHYPHCFQVNGLQMIIEYAKWPMDYPSFDAVAIV